MRLRWTIHFAVALAAAHETVAVDEDLCHTSLLQTSVQITKSEPLQEQEEQQSAWDLMTGHQRAQGHSFASLSTLTSAHGSRAAAQSHTTFFLANAFLVMAIIGLFFWLRPGGNAPAGEPAEGSDDVEVLQACSFDEDVYMMPIALIVRDWYHLAKGVQSRTLPILRMAYAAALLIVTITMQLLLLYCTKAFVTPQQVASIRDSYDAYEQHMYGGEANTRLLYTGKHRGNPGFFQPELFETLDDDVKGEVCGIAFSQLKFLVFVLLLWTITCVASISRCTLYMWNLLVQLPTVSSMMDSVRFDTVGKPRRRCIIIGLTLQAKLAMLFVIFLPWLLSTCYLCWLGCRWLAATNDFGNFISNAMALEFILQFKSLMYFAVCSERTKRDLQTTKHSPPSKTEDTSFVSYFNTLLWGAVAIVWVYAYIFHLQRVLPEYQWDVHAPCTPFLMGQLRPDSGDF